MSETTVLSELIHHLDSASDMELGQAPDDVQEWLETIGVPMSIRRFLQWEWPQVDAQIGHIHLMSSRNVRNNDWADAFSNQKFLCLGSAPNGDFFVLDFSREPCQPGFITHEECWGKNDGLAADLRPYFQPLARSLASLLFRFAEGKYVPTDYYAARDFNSFLAEEAKDHQ